MPSGDRTISDVDRLYEELFGTMPPGEGKAYERISALVMAALGWVDVVHDRTELPEGMTADHQLDVTCRRPDGTVSRLLIECKERDTGKVDQDVISKLAYVRDRIGASHAAVITKRGFTKGARNLAADEDISLLRLRAYEPQTDDGTWITGISTTITLGFIDHTDVELLTHDGWQSADSRRVRTEAWMGYIGGVDDEPEGTWDELYSAGTITAHNEQRTTRETILANPIRVEGVDEWITITGLRWVDVVLQHPLTVSTRAEGTPRLVLEQFNADGTKHAGRVIVGEKLQAWVINPDGTVSRNLIRPER